MAINVDMDPVENEQEALFLMLHHLKLAAKYFEATPVPIPPESFAHLWSWPAITAWLSAMEALYPED